MRGETLWLSATLGKYQKLTLLDTVKIHFQRFFRLSSLQLISNGLNGANINLLTDCGFPKNSCSIFGEDSQSIDFIKPSMNLTHKVKYIVKLMVVWSCFPIYGKLKNHSEKLENNENHYEKLENNEKHKNHFFSH